MSRIIIMFFAASLGAFSAEKSLQLSVEGLEKPEAIERLKASVESTAGVRFEKAVLESRLLSLTFDDQKTTEAKIKKSLSDSGVKVVGNRATLKIKGLFCQSCSNHLTAVLGKTEGVIFVEGISHLTGRAEVTFDPQKTDLTKIKAAVHTTNYKVVEPTKPLPAKTPKS